MSVLLDLASHLIQGGHVDELALHRSVAGLLHSVWVVLDTVEYVVGQELTSLVQLLPFMGTIPEAKELTVAMWMVYL